MGLGRRAKGIEECLFLFLFVRSEHLIIDIEFEVVILGPGA